MTLHARSSLRPICFSLPPDYRNRIFSWCHLGSSGTYLEIPSSDIGFVKEGMQVEISIDSYPATDFGVIKGTLISIGTDALEPDPSEQRNQFVYPARIELASQKLKLKWKTRIGVTTYRTSIQITRGKVFVPSNGNRRRTVGATLSKARMYALLASDDP